MGSSLPTGGKKVCCRRGRARPWNRMMASQKSTSGDAESLLAQVASRFNGNVVKEQWKHGETLKQKGSKVPDL